jgi:hypothetical protein
MTSQASLNVTTSRLPFIVVTETLLLKLYSASNEQYAAASGHAA